MAVHCFLCLGLNEEFVNCINITSEEWKQQNIESLVEKHLLPMAILKSKSPWLCSMCWKILKDFHQFYKRIENTHSFYESLVKPEEVEIGEYEIEQYQTNLSDEFDGYDPICEADISNDVSDCEPIGCYKCKYCCKNLIDRQLVLKHIAWHEDNLYHCNVCDLKYFDEAKFLEHKAAHKSKCSYSHFILNSPAAETSNVDIEMEFQEDEVGPTLDETLDVNLSSCKYCGKMLKEGQNFLNHMAWHEGNVYRCEICDLKYLNNAKFVQHKLTHVSTGKPNHQYGGGSTQPHTVHMLTPKGEYHDDINTSKNVDAQINQQRSKATLSKLQILRRHFAYKWSPNKKKNSRFNREYYRCNYCSKVLRRRRDLLNHMTWHKGHIYHCDLCNLKFFNDAKFKHHQSAHQRSNELEIHGWDEDIEKEFLHLAGDNKAAEHNCYNGKLDKSISSTVENVCNTQTQTIKELDSTSNTASIRCEHCLTSFEERRIFLNHIAWHEGNIYCCDICDLKFVDRSKYDDHKITHAPKNKSTVNESDSVIETYRPTVEETNQSDNNYNPESLIAFDSETELEKEDLTEADGSGDQVCYTCNYCLKVLNEKQLVLNHLSWHEGNIFQCDLCELKFFDKSKFEHHIALHESQQTLDCDHDDVVDDIISDEYFECSHCCKILNDQRHFLYHLSWHNGNIYECDVCDLKFVDKSKFDSHQKTHLPKPRYPCPDCDKSFAYNNHLKLHQEKIHENKHVNLCFICGEYYRCRKSYLRHMSKHKGEEIPKAPCDICGRVLSGKDSLKYHKITQHPKDGILAYICNICLKSFATQSLLNRHTRVAHFEGDGHKCSICNKEFKQKKALKSHMNTHSIEPQIRCQWCPQAFFSSGKLSIHRKKDHPKKYQEWKSSQYVGKVI